MERKTEKKELDEAEKIFSEAEKLGKFDPIFAHHPDDEKYDFYPTVPQDVGNLIKISHSVFRYLDDDE